ncbi:MAG: hypothetical protein IPO32_20220 [Crocinitomicaceae bacterium]|nr:hypothetical protein [Crocinitomicaceae bacterium]
MYISNSKYDLNDPLLKTFFKERGRALMKSIINDKDIICKYHKISAKTNDIIMDSDQNTISMSVTPTHFSYLSFNLNLRISAKVLYHYENRWSWSGISGHPNLIMTLKNEIFNHPLTVWQSFKNNDSLSNIESLNDYNYNAHSFQHMGSRLDKSIEPSISTNPSIKWTQDLMFKYGDKIDFWSVALYAEIENSVLTQNMDRLNENRFYETVFTRHSDWRDNYPYYRNGWENLCMNLKTSNKSTSNKSTP